MDCIWCLAWHLATPDKLRGENALPPFWADSVLLCIHYSASFCSPFKSFPQFLPNFALLRFVLLRKVSHFVLLRLQWLGTRQHGLGCILCEQPWGFGGHMDNGDGSKTRDLRARLDACSQLLKVGDGFRQPSTLLFVSPAAPESRMPHREQ